MHTGGKLCLYTNPSKQFSSMNGFLRFSIVVSGSWPISIPDHRRWKWPRRVSDHYKKTAAQCDKLDRFVARHRRFYSRSGLPTSRDVANGGRCVGATKRNVVSVRRVSSEPQPADGWSLCLHHQTIKVLYSTDHQEGRPVDCCRVAGFLCAAPATLPHLWKKRSSGFTDIIRIFRYRRVSYFASARFTIFGRTYFRDRSTPRATNENTNEAGAFQSTGGARLRNVFAQ